MSDKPGLPKTRIEPLYEYEELIKGQPTTYDWPDLPEDTNAVLYYTTGTTGLPKGVLYTNRQIYLHCLHSIAKLGNGYTAARRSATPQSIDTDDECSLFPYPCLGSTLFQCLWAVPRLCFPADSPRKASVNWCRMKK